MLQDPKAAREELIRLCRNSKSRRVEFTKKAPCDWQPMSVSHPRFGGYFSDRGAWEYVAELLEDGHPIENVMLDSPLIPVF